MKHILSVEGIIGSGKTTLSNKIAELLKLKPFFEPVDDNPYLKPFYEDPKK
jgi:deoxyadenosine/deoxycytidine kinase